MTDYSNEHSQKPVNDLAIKLLACALIVLCLMVGLAGLLLPIIPGLLFLALAGIITAHYFPPVERYMRRSPQLSAYLDSFGNFSHLHWSGKLSLVGWLCLKILIDTLAFIIKLVIRLLHHARQ